MHLKVKDDLEARGLVLDIGGGRRQTYLQYAHSDLVRVVTMDIEPGPKVDVVASATNMPLDRDSMDSVICFNVLEHIFDHRAALAEICRVMKPAGELYGWVPFTIGVHGAPNDYFRYTSSSLEKLLLESGLEPICIECCGNVFLSSFDLLRPHIRGWFVGRVLRILCLCLALVGYPLHVGLKRLVGERSPTPDPSPSGIWFTARVSAMQDRYG